MLNIMNIRIVYDQLYRTYKECYEPSVTVKNLEDFRYFRSLNESKLFF